MALHTLRTQLNTDSRTSGDDCGAVTCINGIIWASDGKVGPKSQDEVGDWVRRVRRWSNKPYGGLLLAGDCLQIYKHPSLRDRFKEANVMPMIATYAFRTTWDTVGRQLIAGRFVHLPVNYGVLRRGDAPMGSDTFRGGHSIALLHAPSQNGRRRVWDGDPLFDGRRGEYPKGWQNAKLVDFKAAAAAWGKPLAGYDHAYAIFLRRG